MRMRVLLSSIAAVEAGAKASANVAMPSTKIAFIRHLVKSHTK